MSYSGGKSIVNVRHIVSVYGSCFPSAMRPRKRNGSLVMLQLIRTMIFANTEYVLALMKMYSTSHGPMV